MQTLASYDDEKGLFINPDYVKNLMGDVVHQQLKRIALGPTMLNISKAKFPSGDKQYIIMLYISRGWGNVRISFINIKTSLTLKDITRKIFHKFKYKLPKGEYVDRRHRMKYVFRDTSDDQMMFIQVSVDHAYIYVAEKLDDNENYPNSFCGAKNFVYRKNPEDAPKCFIM